MERGRVLFEGILLTLELRSYPISSSFLPYLVLAELDLPKTCTPGP